VIPALLLTVALAAPPDPVFTVRDERIDENSGMVDLGDLTVVTNDSGDTGRVFVLDRTGRTVGVTTYGDDARDVEALAPGGGRSVWVGDIGDNDEERDHVTVRRIGIARGDRTVTPASYRLVYPDGAHDAETLLRDPTTGRLYVATKGLLGGAVYAAPSSLHRGTNRLTKVAPVSVFATDGSFLSDGAHVLIRGYTTLSLYSFPAFRMLGTVDLPEQPQGESLSVGPGDRIRIGTEGKDEPVLPVTLPADLAAQLAPPATATASPAEVDDAARPTGKDDDVDSRGADIAFWPVLGGIALAGAGTVRVARSRRKR
jgi:hypothetical protein